jgi:hypoxanthine phosphoribosyltransferase
MKKNDRNTKDPEYVVPELKLLYDEWQETRRSIDRFDHISIDIRKYGFGLITFMLTASSIAFDATNLNSPMPVLIVPFSIMILLCALFLADRYHEALLMGCIMRARQLEDTSQQILETRYTEGRIFFRLNLTTFLEDKIQKIQARKYSLYIYGLFLFACFLLGIFSLITFYQQHNANSSVVYFAALLLMWFCSILMLRAINHSMLELIAKLEKDVMVDERIVVRKLFQPVEVHTAVKRLSKEIDFAFNNQNFKMLTVGMGGIDFAQKLFLELKRMGRTNIETIAAFSESVIIGKAKDGRDIYKIRLKPPKKHQIQGKDILIIDDLVATGNTLQTLKRLCEENGARTVRTCVLLDAFNLRDVDGLDIDFTGLPTPETGRFIGCGMDYEFQYRDFEFIGMVLPHKSLTG